MKVSDFRLPVVARELTQLAQKRSTYRLRCLGVGLPLFICVVFLMISKAQAKSTLELIGSGGTLHLILYITLLCVVYLFAPALSCSAITAEKEKQTLGLILISRLSPLSLILEKICSRIIPLLSLVVGSAPLFGIAFLMGGVTIGDTLGAVGCLVYVTLQVTIVAVCISAVMKSSVAAFWVTNAVLASMYFGAPILAEMQWFPSQGPSSMRDDWLFLFPPYQFDVLSESFQFGTSITTNFDLFWVTIPSFVLTVAFLFGGWKALMFFGDLDGITFRGMGRRIVDFQAAEEFSRVARRLLNCLPGVHVRESGTDGKTISPISQDESGALARHEHLTCYEAAYRPIYWRERSSMPFLNWKIWSGVLAILGLLSLSVCASNDDHFYTDEVAAFVLCSLVAVLLIMITLATRVFTRERDQQTLESVLALPLSNLEILNEKTAALNGAVWLLASPLLLVTSISNVMSGPSPYHDGDLIFTLCVMSHTVLYLHLVKWISIYCGLRLKTTIKAMVGSLAAVIGLCVGLVAIVLTVLISSGGSPDDNVFWFYSSPVIVPMVGAFRDLDALYRGNNMAESGLLCLAINLSVYFALMRAVKTLTIRSLPMLLQRCDDDSLAEFRTVSDISGV